MIFISFIFYYRWQTLFTLRVSLILSSLIDIADDEGSVEFSPKAKFVSPLHVHIILATDIDPASLLLTQLLQSC